MRLICGVQLYLSSPSPPQRASLPAAASVGRARVTFLCDAARPAPPPVQPGGLGYQGVLKAGAASAEKPAAAGTRRRTGPGEWDAHCRRARGTSGSLVWRIGVGTSATVMTGSGMSGVLAFCLAVLAHSLTKRRIIMFSILGYCFALLFTNGLPAISRPVNSLLLQ